MDLKVGDRVNTPEGCTGTVSVISGDSIDVNVKRGLDSYIQILHVSEVTKVDPPEAATAKPSPSFPIAFRPVTLNDSPPPKDFG